MLHQPWCEFAKLRIQNEKIICCVWGGGGVGGYVPPQRVWFLRRFGLKTGVNFAYFCLNSGIVFEGIPECMNKFVVSIPNE